LKDELFVVAVFGLLSEGLLALFFLLELLHALLEILNPALELELFEDDLSLNPLPIEYLVLLLVKAARQEEVKRFICEFQSKVDTAVLFIELVDLVLKSQVINLSGCQPSAH